MLQVGPALSVWQSLQRQVWGAERSQADRAVGAGRVGGWSVIFVVPLFAGVGAFISTTSSSSLSLSSSLCR